MKNRFMMLYSKIKRVIKNPKAYCKYYSARLNKIITLILSYLRIKLRRLSIRNRKVSLLSHDCTGAVLLHTVGLPFNSPTVNLYFPNLHEYIKYVRYLEEYSKLPVKVDKEAKEVFPCGVISHHEYGKVHLCFNHDISFDDANENWVRRSKRLNHKDIRALLVVKSYDEEVLCDFLSLSCKKAIITFPDIYVSVLEFCKNRKSPEVVSCLDYTGPRSVGEFLRPSGIFGRRPIEDFDIVQFVNMR